MNTFIRPATVFTAFTLLALTTAHAQYTWDTTTGDAVVTEGAGTWQVGTGNWWDGAADQVWADGNNATFGGGTAGTAGTVTLGGDVAVGTLFFGIPSAGDYTLDLAGNSLTVNDLNANMGARNATIQNGTIDFGAGNKTLNLTSTGTLTISALITGTGNISKSGAGNLLLSNDLNSFSGSFSVNNARNVTVSSISASGVPSAAGAGSSLAASNNATLRYIGTGDTTDRDLRIGNTKGVIQQDGTGPLIFTGDFFNTSSNTNTNTLDLRGANTDENEIQGVIADDATGDNLILSKNQAGTWVLSGANTYEGKTNIIAGILTANAPDVASLSGALGNGGVIDFNGGTLQYTALSSGTDYGSRFGDSTQAIRLNTNGQDVTLASVIDGTNTAGMIKTGAGTLSLAGDNLYTGNTFINGGIVQADIADTLDGVDPTIVLSGAFGAGGNIDFGGGTLQYTANTAGTDYSARIANSTSAIAIDTNGQDVTLATQLVGNTGGLTKLGAGQLTAVWDESYSGPTTVEEGTLVLVNTSASNKNSSSASFLINNASTLKIEKGVGGLIVNSETFTFDSAGGGTLEINGSQSLWRANTIVTTGGIQNTLGGTAYLNMQNTRSVTYIVADGTDAVDLLVSNEHERGSIVKQGEGTLAVTNTFNDLLDTNTITIEAGVFEVATSGRIKRGNWAGAMTNDGFYRHSSSANQTLSGAISGTGSLEMSGSGTLTLGGANTYSGDTTVSAGTLTLADGGGLTFVPTADTVSNQVLGTGTLNLDGELFFDLSGAALADGHSWLIIDVTNLTETFGGTFSVNSSLGAFTNDAGVWTYVDGAYEWSFSQATGTLSFGLTTFGTWATAEGATLDPAANDDGDSLVNLLEFAFGTNPTSSDATGLVINGGSFTAGTPVVEVTSAPLDAKARFIRRTDHTTAGITYTVQFSNDLMTWAAEDDLDGATAVIISGTSASGDYEAVEIDYPLFLNGGKKARFFRLSINTVATEEVSPE